MTARDRDTLNSNLAVDQATNGTQKINAEINRRSIGDGYDSMLLPEDYQSTGLYLASDQDGLSVTIGTTRAPLQVTWLEAISPSGAMSQDPAAGVGTQTMTVRGRYQVHFSMSLELNESDTVFMEWWVSTNGGPFEKSEAGTLFKFRRNQLDLATASFDVIFDIDETQLPVVIQPQFFCDGSTRSPKVLVANTHVSGWGRTDDQTPDDIFGV